LQEGSLAKGASGTNQAATGGRKAWAEQQDNLQKLAELYGTMEDKDYMMKISALLREKV